MFVGGKNGTRRTLFFRTPFLRSCLRQLTPVCAGGCFFLVLNHKEQCHEFAGPKPGSPAGQHAREVYPSERVRLPPGGLERAVPASCGSE